MSVYVEEKDRLKNSIGLRLTDSEYQQVKKLSIKHLMPRTTIVRLLLVKALKEGL